MLAESGTGDEVITSIAGHVGRHLLSRYNHVRNEAKRKALEEIYARQTAAEGAMRKKRNTQKQAQRNGTALAIGAPTLDIQ